MRLNANTEIARQFQQMTLIHGRDCGDCRCVCRMRWDLRQCNVSADNGRYWIAGIMMVAQIVFGVKLN